MIAKSEGKGGYIQKDGKTININLPYNIAAEKEVLGGLIYDNNYINVLTDVLKPEYFYVGLHGVIFSIASRLIEKGKVADLMNVEMYLSNKDNLSKFFEGFKEDGVLSQIKAGFEEMGGVNYLKEVFGEYIIGFTNIKERGEMIRDLFLRRQIIELTRDTTNAVLEFDVNTTAYNHIEKLEGDLFNLTQEKGTVVGGFKTFKSSLQDVKEQIKAAMKRGGMSGLDTGFRDLNDKLHGWQPSDLVIVAGRPSMGKTSFAIALAINAAQSIESQIADGKDANEAGTVAVFSLEMGADQLSTRVLSVFSGIDTHCLRGGSIDDMQFASVVKSMGDLESLPIYIDETPAITVAQLRTRARRLKRRFGLSLLIVDYLQLLRGSGNGDHNNRVQEITQITQGLKAIAKELNVPVIALSQLSRNVESRDDKRPQLSDLRESGSIEQDADIVIFLYRDSYYLERTRPEGDPEKLKEWESRNQNRLNDIKNKAEIIIAKHRNGPIGTVMLRFDEETTKFESLARGYKIE